MRESTPVLGAVDPTPSTGTNHRSLQGASAMMTPVVDVVMLGSAVVSTSCCLAAPERTTTRAQALAIAMPMAMAAAMMVDSMTVAWLGAAVLLMLSGSLFIGGRGVRLADLHRGSEVS